jgi:hypothetical protein
MSRLNTFFPTTIFELSEVCDKRPINNTATWQGLYDFSLTTEQETRTQIFHTDVDF